MHFLSLTDGICFCTFCNSQGMVSLSKILGQETYSALVKNLFLVVMQEQNSGSQGQRLFCLSHVHLVGGDQGCFQISCMSHVSPHSKQLSSLPYQVLRLGNHGVYHYGFCCSQISSLVSFKASLCLAFIIYRVGYATR